MADQTQTLDLLKWKEAFADGMVGESPELLDQLRVARRVAETDCTVLINGETGTGKELMARAIHAGSARREGPFVAVNCAAIPDDLIEDELFGHVAGAFSGAHRDRVGRVLSADTGTLFLDEVGDLPARAQAKLLRVIQERVITPLGSDETISVDVRLVAATHRDLARMVQEGVFREDLYFRLNVIPIELPALRTRGQDIIALARSFMASMAQRYRRRVTSFSREAEQAMLRHSWPGNVRELKNAVERAVLLARGEEIGPSDLGLSHTSEQGTHEPDLEPENLDLKEALRRTEARLIEKALARTGGNRTEAAALLGLNRTTLLEKLKKSGV